MKSKLSKNVSKEVRVKYELVQAKERIKLLEGQLKALQNSKLSLEDDLKEANRALKRLGRALSQVKEVGNEETKEILRRFDL
jgi:predicted  nucleic acid-binding Zn-ribbon protein